MISATLGTFAILAGAFGTMSAPVNGNLAPSRSMSICDKNIELGVFPAVFFKKFEGSGCTVYKTDDPDLFAVKRSAAERPVGTVKFSHGLLSTITREWAIDANSSEDLAKAVVDSLQQMQAQGASQCVIVTHNHASPSSEEQISELKCGERSLVFILMTQSDRKEIQIEEILSN